MGDLAFLLVRLAHALSAALWVGGTLAWVLAAPTGDGTPWRPLRAALRPGIAVFVLTGALMAAERLASAPLPPAYFAILALKVGLALWMFSVARHLGSPGSTSGWSHWWRRPEGQLVVLGMCVYGLAMALRAIYDGAIRP